MNWKPIHTLAPNVVVLVALARSHIPVVAVRHGDGPGIGAVCDYRSGDHLLTATHWMPLPQVPA